MMTRSKQDSRQEKTKQPVDFSQKTRSKDRGEEQDDATESEDNPQSGQGAERPKTPTRMQMWDILLEIRQDMKELVKENKTMADEVRELRRSLEINDAELTELKKENTVLRKCLNETSAKCETLVKQVMDLDSQQDELEQYSRKVCLVIRGVPEESQENLEETVVNLARKLDVPIVNDDVEIVHRMPSKSTESRPIIVRFWNYKHKQRLYAARFKLRNLRLSDITGGSRHNSPIFITESLTRKRSQILAACLQARKSSEKVESVWTMDGKIFIKEHFSGKALRINSVEHVKRYVAVDNT